MSWFDGLWKSSNSGAWSPFCQALAGELGRKEFRDIAAIRLFQNRDVIASPERTWRRAYSPPQYTTTEHLQTWTAHE